MQKCHHFHGAGYARACRHRDVQSALNPSNEISIPRSHSNLRNGKMVSYGLGVSSPAANAPSFDPVLPASF